jgi:DNA polymerase-1
MADKKLFLLDAFALIYRAHFAFSKNPRISSKGVNTGAVLGFINTVMQVLKKEKPTHIGVAFDMKGPTFRHVEFPEYKAHREAQPEDISVAIPYIRAFLDGMNIPIIEKAGFEADDVIGTLAKVGSKKGFDVFMMTPDKDYAQLVEEHVFMFKPAFMGNKIETLGIPEVLEKFQIERVEQVIDILGMEGDAADNIPGIPGVGKKTAIKLLADYGSMEGLYENTDKLKGKLKEKVEANKEQAFLSKRLATIIIDVPVDFSEEDLLISEPNQEDVIAIFDELEFRTLKKSVFGITEPTPTVVKKSLSRKPAANPDQMDMFGNTSPAPETLGDPEDGPLATIDTVTHDYHLIDTKEQRVALLGKLMNAKEVCFDTETTGLDALDALMVGMSFSVQKGEAFYVPVPPTLEEAMPIVTEFKSLFEHRGIKLIGQNIKYDIKVLKKYKVRVHSNLFDNMLAHYLLEPDQRHNMDVLAENYLNYSPVSIEKLIGKKGKNQLSMADLDPAMVSDYACEDADITFQLKEVFEPMLKERGELILFDKVEIPLVNVLASMEEEGITVDVDFLGKMSGELGGDALAAQEKVFELAGQEFNVASPKQLGEVLFEKMQLVEKPKKTKTGQYATGEEILTKLANEHEICAKILEFREYKKLKSTYVDAIPKLVKEDKRVHTNYSQAVAATGRLSSNDPNLQNIPIRTEKGRAIRKAFVPKDENHTLFSADYSQIELRIMAEFSGDESMKEAFANGLDIHKNTASKVFKVTLDEVDSDMRRKAKEVNFGIIYGMSAFGLSQNLNIPRKEAAEIIKAYFEEFSSIKAYMDKQIEFAQENGFVKTILGRRRYLRDINSRNATVRGYAERNAVNAPIQGSAADMIKVAMINIDKWMRKEGLKSKMLLQVHDELIFDAHNDELELLQSKVEYYMANAIPMKVPLEVGMGTGANWLEAH